MKIDTVAGDRTTNTSQFNDTSQFRG